MRYIYFLFFLLFFTSCSYFNRKYKESLKKVNITGKVIKKYFDDWNHGAATVIYIDKNGQSKCQMDDWSRYSNLWTYLQIGDSIIKPSGTLTLKVKKRDGRFKNYKYQE